MKYKPTITIKKVPYLIMGTVVIRLGHNNHEILCEQAETIKVLNVRYQRKAAAMKRAKALAKEDVMILAVDTRNQAWAIGETIGKAEMAIRREGGKSEHCHFFEVPEGYYIDAMGTGHGKAKPVRIDRDYHPIV